MGTIFVGIGGIGISGRPNDVLKTFALGTCVAVIMLDSERRVAAMLHAALPESSIDRQLAVQKPGYFVDTGIHTLLQKMFKYGCRKGNLSIKLVGGASILDPDRRFDIGTKNLLAVRKCLNRYNLNTIAEDTGKDISRTVSVHVLTGAVRVASPGVGEWNL